MKYLKRLNKWHDVPEYGGLYMITNRNGGMVKSRDRVVAGRNGFKLKRGKILRQFVRGKYKSVGLSKRNFVTCYDVHVLLAKVFIPNPENKRTVNHNDGDRFNNNISNLSWATHSEQLIHANKMGLFKSIPPTKKGDTLSEETKRKMSAARKGRVVTPKTRRLISKALIKHYNTLNTSSQKEVK